MTLKTQGPLGQEGGVSLQAPLAEGDSAVASVPLAGQGAAADHIKEASSQISPVGGSIQQLQAMKEAFQNPPRDSKKCPKTGCFNMAPAPPPSGPWSSLQAVGLLPTAGRPQDLAGRQLGAQDQARALEPSDFGQVASPL